MASCKDNKLIIHSFTISFDSKSNSSGQVFSWDLTVKSCNLQIMSETSLRISFNKSLPQPNTSENGEEQIVEDCHQQSENFLNVFNYICLKNKLKNLPYSVRNCFQHVFLRYKLFKTKPSQKNIEEAEKFYISHVNGMSLSLSLLKETENTTSQEKIDDFVKHSILMYNFLKEVQNL